VFVQYFLSVHILTGPEVCNMVTMFASWILSVTGP